MVQIIKAVRIWAIFFSFFGGRMTFGSLPCIIKKLIICPGYIPESYSHHKCTGYDLFVNIRLMGAIICNGTIIDMGTVGFIMGGFGFVHRCIGIRIRFRGIFVFSCVIHKAL